MHNLDSNHTLLTVEEAAQFLRIRPRTVFQYASRGKLRKVKIGKCLRFRKSDLESFIDECADPATAARE